MSNTNQQNMITQGTTLFGDIFSEGDFRIEGNIKGNIKTSGKIVVGKTGVINGSLEGENADFEGSFSGKLKLSNNINLSFGGNELKILFLSFSSIFSNILIASSDSKFLRMNIIEAVDSNFIISD